jgi:signal transduction histidine kinase
MTHRPLAWRLGLVLAVAVLGVLLLVGLVVNRVVSERFQTVVTAQQVQRLDDAAATLADRFDRPLRVVALVRRLATTLDGSVQVVGADGTVVAAFGRPPDGGGAEYATPIVVDGVTVATLQAVLPGSGSDRGFLPLFNVTLIVAGIVSLLGIVFISTVLADRLTRPLRDVAVAARRLERGESDARATGGDDRESAELAAAFNAMADRLERSEMLRRRAASDIAHDLATPATVLETQLQAMIDGVVPTDPTNLEAARSAAGALGGLVAELGDLASAEAAPLVARPGPIDGAAAVGDAVRALDALARDRGVSITVDVADGLVAWADPGHVARALQNVVGNAVGHSPRGGTVTVAGRGGGTAVEIRVIDQGTGIDDADVAHVFERFYRADPARTGGAARGAAGAGPTGHGLGLTIARELLAANGGVIVVEATGPSGTTFAITLPAAGRAS